MHKRFNKHGNATTEANHKHSAPTKSCIKLKKETESGDVNVNESGYNRKTHHVRKRVSSRNFVKSTNAEGESYKHKPRKEVESSKTEHKKHHERSKEKHKSKHATKVRKSSSVSFGSADPLAKNNFYHQHIKQEEVVYCTTNATKSPMDKKEKDKPATKIYYPPVTHKEPEKSKHHRHSHSHKYKSEKRSDVEITAIYKKPQEVPSEKPVKEKSSRKTKKNSGVEQNNSQLVFSVHSNKIIPNSKLHSRPHHHQHQHHHRTEATESKTKILQESMSSVNIGPYEKYFEFAETSNNRSNRKKLRKKKDSDVSVTMDKDNSFEMEMDRKLRHESCDFVKSSESIEQVPTKDKTAKDNRHELDNYLQAISNIIDRKLESFLKGETNLRKPDEAHKNMRRYSKNTLKSESVVTGVGPKVEGKPTFEEVSENTTHDILNDISSSYMKFKKKRKKPKITLLRYDPDVSALLSNLERQHLIRRSKKSNDSSSLVNTIDSRKLYKKHKSTDKFAEVHNNHVRVVKNIEENETNFVVEGIEPAKSLNLRKSSKNRLKQEKKRVALECKTVAIVGIPPTNEETTSCKKCYCEDYIEQRKKRQSFKLYYNYSDLSLDAENNNFSDSNKQFLAGTTDTSSRNSEINMRNTGKPTTRQVETSTSNTNAIESETQMRYLIKTSKRKSRIVIPDLSRLKNIVEEPSNVSVVKKDLWEDIDLSNDSLRIIKRPAFSDVSQSSISNFQVQHSKEVGISKSFGQQASERKIKNHSNQKPPKRQPKKITVDFGVQKSKSDISVIPEEDEFGPRSSKIRSSSYGQRKRNRSYDPPSKEARIRRNKVETVPVKNDRRSKTTGQNTSIQVNVKPKTPTNKVTFRDARKETFGEVVQPKDKFSNRTFKTRSASLKRPKSETTIESDASPVAKLKNRKDQKKPATTNPEPVGTRKKLVSRSKSEVNIPNKSPQSDESIATSLTTLDKFCNNKRSNSPKCMSMSNSTDYHHHMDKNPAVVPYSTSLFLTKDYSIKNNKLSSYEKRKSYDESIRKRNKKRIGRSNPYFYEVRYLTVEHNQQEEEPQPKPSEEKIIVPTVVSKKPPKPIAIHYKEKTYRKRDESVVCKILEAPIDKDSGMYVSGQPMFFAGFSSSSASENISQFPTLNRLEEKSSDLLNWPCLENLKDPRKDHVHDDQMQLVELLEPPGAEHLDNSNVEISEPENITNILDFIYKTIIYSRPASFTLSQHDLMEPPKKKRAYSSCSSVLSINHCEGQLFTAKSSVNLKPQEEIVSEVVTANETGDEFQVLKERMSCPVIASNPSIFEFLYEDYPGECFDTLKSLENVEVTKNVFVAKEDRHFTNISLSTNYQYADSNEINSSAESGYGSVHSRKCLSLTNFFKRPNIAALFKYPSLSENFTKSNSDLNKNVLFFNHERPKSACSKYRVNLYNKMVQECQSYAHKVRVQSEENKLGNIQEPYKEIPLEVLLRKPTAEVLAESFYLEYDKFHKMAGLSSNSKSVINPSNTIPASEKSFAVTESSATETILSGVSLDPREQEITGEESEKPSELNDELEEELILEVLPDCISEEMEVKQKSSKVVQEKPSEILKVSYNDKKLIHQEVKKNAPSSFKCLPSVSEKLRSVKSELITALPRKFSEPLAKETEKILEDTIGVDSYYKIQNIAAGTAIVNQKNDSECERHMHSTESTAKKDFFEKLLNAYEKEMELTRRLSQDELFFKEELLKALDKTSSKRGFKRFFRRKKKNKSSIESCSTRVDEGESDTQTENGFDDSFETESTINNYEQLQSLATNAKRHFSLLAQAVTSNQSLSDQIKVCGFLRLLERIENGDFSLLRVIEKEEDVSFENEIRMQIKEAFVQTYDVSFKEAKKTKRKLAQNDLELLRCLVSRYRLGSLSHTNLIASYIGRGFISTENQLLAAITYLIRFKTRDINFDDFEEFCKRKL